MDDASEAAPSTGGKKRYVSSIDVAKRAGVSQAAVSRTFTAGASVSAKTRAKVQAAAEELGYRPSMIPRIMFTNRSSLIAVVSSGVIHPFYASIMDRFADEIQKLNKTVLFFSVKDRDYLDEVIPKIGGYQVDGILSASSIASKAVADRLAQMQVPVVLLNSRLRNEWVHSVNSDNVSGGREVASLLIRKGARKFAFVAGRRGNMTSEDRLAGFVGRLAEDGLTDLRIEYGNYTFEGGCLAARHIIGGSDRPTGVFCANDLMAIGFLETARTEFGLRAPDDLMVAGFDDIPAAAWPSIGLTTVRPDADRMVSEALALMEGRLAGQIDSGGLLKVVPIHLIERASTSRADA